ncbi:sigma-70 family RNA polymerase sigma factor [Streptosporangiaceae bacterium NEAU-GS5]|nr:sigma-70 family RNA polymerase sigma factor [Streptosporangiaceae bacterium NEAU-GS5]
MSTVEQAYREHWARLLALLASELRDLDLAEDALQEAYAIAVDRWRRDGEPRNPAGWLLTAARNRALDRLRRAAVATRNLTELSRRPLLIVDDPGQEQPIPDERLRLVFTCCHPALAMDARVALTLRCVGGLTTREIARLFLVSEPTMAARITRAKKKIAQAGIPYRVPDNLGERLPGVLAVVYLIFTEGYAATGGDRLLRHELAAEAIHLGRMLRQLMPADSEVRGLLALMILHHARREARLGPAGELIRLGDQDRRRWRATEIAEGLDLISTPGPAGPPPGQPGPYLLQAAIAAEHASAPTAAGTDWKAIALLYGELERITGSAVVRLNRAVAVAEVAGPQAALDLLDGLEEALPYNHLLPATRAEMWRRLGRAREAMDCYAQALDLAGTGVERAFLAARRDDLGRVLE